MNGKLPRGVLDTNVLVSALLLPDSVPRRAFDALVDNGAVLISVPLILELAEVLNREKFDKYVTLSERRSFLVRFLKVSEMIEVTETVTACRDSKDNMLLELAVGGRAEYLITGDKDLLVLDTFRNVKIIEPAEFLFKAV